MFRDDKPYSISTQTFYDELGRISSSTEVVNRENRLCDDDKHRKDYNEIISVRYIYERPRAIRLSTDFSAHFDLIYCRYLLDLLVSEGMLEHEKMVFYRENLPIISTNNQLKNHMKKIFIACGQENYIDLTFARKIKYDEMNAINKISYIGLPVSFKQPSPDEYKAYASSCNFFARKHKIDEGSGFALSTPLLNMICGYLAYYNEIISAITPGYCNLQPGFLLAWNNNHCDSKDVGQTDKSAFRK